MGETATKAARKSRARQRGVVLGAIDERMQMLAEVATPEVVEANMSRLLELMDELKRSLNGKETEE